VPLWARLCDPSLIQRLGIGVGAMVVGLLLGGTVKGARAQVVTTVLLLPMLSALAGILSTLSP
jgi:hypothetical protein